MNALRYALRRRGWHWRPRPTDALLLPRSRAGRAEFLALLRHYSFRLLLRDVIAHGADFGIDELTRYCSAASAGRYVDRLLALGLVRRRGDRFRLADPRVRSFGATLEWFVAAILASELGIDCAANVRLEDGVADGDFDVVGLLEGALLYVEVKSSPPRNVEIRQANAFCRRLAALQPDSAIFFNDTQLHMAPKMLPLLRGAYRAAFGACRVRRLAPEICLLGSRVYVMNSDPDLVANIERCVAHRLQQGMAGPPW